jgi:predicted TIM-barrel fold metal-dependent hydrolase
MPDLSATPRTLAIDAFVNPRMGSMKRPEWLVRVAEDYFHRTDAIFKDIEVEELVDLMDEHGIERAILATRAEEPDEVTLSFPRAHPDRFFLSVSVDPRRGMKAVQAIESLARNEPVLLARVFPFMTGLAPTDRSYYPVFAKCCELKLPISVNTGIPGPPAPGWVQHPMHLDEVCLFFPELTLVMAHGADPWWNEAIRLMLKYRNLYLMTSAFAPKYFPPELLRYMATRGRHKIIFASDHPVLSMGRCVREAREHAALNEREGVLQAFLRDNARRVFWGEE